MGLFLYCFWPCHVACEILVPPPGIEPVPPAVEARSLKSLDRQGSPENKNQIIRHFFSHVYLSTHFFQAVPSLPFCSSSVYLQWVCKIGFPTFFVSKEAHHIHSLTLCPTSTLPCLACTHFLLCHDNYHFPQVPVMVFCWLSPGRDAFS